MKTLSNSSPAAHLVVEPSSQLAREMKKHSIPSIPSKNKSKTFFTVHDLHTLRQKLKADKSSNIHLHQLLRSSTVFVPEQEKETPKSLLERRKYLKLRQEQNEYDELTKELSKGRPDEALQKEMSSMRNQLSTGMNMIAARFTAFVALYMVSHTLSTNQTFRILAGLFGSVAMMVIEMILHITRSTKQEHVAKLQRKLAQNPQT